MRLNHQGWLADKGRIFSHLPLRATPLKHTFNSSANWDFMLCCEYSYIPKLFCMLLN